MVNIPLYVTYTKASGILKEVIDMRLSSFWPNMSFQLDLQPYWIIPNYFYKATSLNMPLFHFSLEYPSPWLRKIKFYPFLKIRPSVSQSLPQLEVMSTFLNSLALVTVPVSHP